MKITKPTFGSKTHQLATPALLEQALAKQNIAQYKEAIELYKELLKREQNPVWQQSLADCYLQRALALADKGMEKEAIVLWENYAGLDKKHQYNEAYLSWLLHTGNYTKITNYLKKLSIAEIDEQYLDLSSLLGLWIVSGVKGIYQSLPAESVFVKHSFFALEALTAYQNNNIAGVELALKKIPYRSVYKDFRTLLKAAMLFNTDLTQANSLLSSIAENSPYQKFIQLLNISQQTDQPLINGLIKLTPYQQAAISQTKGWTVKQLKLLQTYSRDKNRLTDNLKFNLAIEYKSIIGDEFAQRFCQALLISHSGLEKNYKKNFGNLTDFDKARLRALQAEKNSDYFYDVEENWNDCIAILRCDEQKNSLKIALILRHLTKFLPPKKQVSVLEKSLNYDANDKATYLTLLGYYAQENDKDKLKYFLEKAFKHFPEDVDILTFAMIQAKNNKAFKKATQFANAILKIDSVNTHAKEFLFVSHIEHARKLFKAKNFALCKKEIAQIGQLSLNSRYQTLAQMMLGFLLFSSEDKQTGADLINSACLQLNDGDFVSYYRITNEALLLGISLTTLLRFIPSLNKDYIISETEISRFIKVLEFQHQEKNPFIDKAIAKVKAVFKQSLKKQPLDEKTMLSLCECLDKIKYFELLRYCLSIVDYISPVWDFYKVYANVDGNPDKLKNFQIYLLEDYLQAAKQQKDDKAVTLIASFLEKTRMKKFLFDFEDEYEDEYDEFEGLFDHVPENIMVQLEKKIESFNFSNPMKMMKLFTKYVSPMDMMLFIKNEDAMLALHFVIASNELGIDIGVTVKDVKALLN